MDISQIKCYFEDDTKQFNQKSVETTKDNSLQNNIIENVKQILTTFRIDIKNYGNKENAVEVIADNCYVSTPLWYKDSQGQGVVVECNSKVQKITLRIIKNGKLTICFKGIYRCCNDHHIPLWVNYRSIKINGQEILSDTVNTWHDKPFNYSMYVVDKQVISVEIEQSNHQYLNSEIRDIISQLYPNEKNTDLLVAKVKEYFSSLVVENKYASSFSQMLKVNCYLQKTLSIRSYKNAYILPCKFNGFGPNTWAKGGVLDEEKNYIVSSCQLREMDGKYEFQEYDTIEEPVLYFGLFFEHWGHFLLEYISRLWAVIKYPDKFKDIKIAYLPMRENDKIRGTFQEFLYLCGIKQEQLIAITHPMQCKEILIPDSSSFNPSATYTDEYKIIINTVVDKAKNTNMDMKIFDNIYLSHNSLNNYYSRDIGEDNIEKLFESNGFQIINPEKMTLVEQIKIINSAKKIVSPLGTLSHNFLFANSTSQLTIIGKYLGYSNYQMFVDSVISRKPIYVDCSASIFPFKDGAGPFLYLYNRNLKLYAEDNNYEIPDINSTETIKKYIEISAKKYKFDKLTIADIVNTIKAHHNTNIEDIGEILAVMLEIIANHKEVFDD
ncbi:MAG: glycosyltransferase family 61 protein [Alphaproteobacteria bacterium]|nr:glycosyltransferase family 61 protein [Alphaproteobacteria bacterium]